MLFIVLFFNNKSLRWMALRRSHFQCGKCEGRRSQSSVARTPSLALPPRWARKEFCVVVCATLLTFVCMLRYSEWNVGPIWFLDSSIFMVVRCADLAPVLFNIYGGTLCRSGFWFLDSGFFDVSLMFSLMFASVPYSGFFPSAGSVSQRKVASGRAAAEEG